MSIEQLQIKKNNSHCARFGKYGRWFNDHNEDGRLNNNNSLVLDQQDHPINSTMEIKIVMKILVIINILLINKEEITIETKIEDTKKLILI